MQEKVNFSLFFCHFVSNVSVFGCIFSLAQHLNILIQEITPDSRHANPDSNKNINF